MSFKTRLCTGFLFAFLFVVAYANAQQLPVNLRFDKFTTEDGLSDNYVHDIIKDKQGYLWVSTQNGLNRFDGVEFKTFFHDPDDSNSLLSNYVSFIVEDSLGRIWAATSGGLCVYNTITGKFRNFIPPQNKYFKSRINKVLMAHDGSIWFSTLNHISTIDLKTFSVLSYPIDSVYSETNGAAVDFFCEDHNGNFWFDSYHGLCLFDRKTHGIKMIDKNWGLSSFYDDGKGECCHRGHERTF